MLLKTIGLVFVVLAIIGVFLPLLPTTPFLLVASACFAKSSPALYQKLNNNKVFGPLIKNWNETRSIPKKGKVIALLSMMLAMCYSLWVLELWYLKVLVVVFILFPFVFVSRLPLTEELTEKLIDNKNGNLTKSQTKK